MGTYISLTRSACFAQETIRRVLREAIGPQRNVEIRQLTMSYSKHCSSKECIHTCVRFSAGIVSFTGKRFPYDLGEYGLEQPFVGQMTIGDSNLDGDLVYRCGTEGWLEWTNPRTGEQDAVCFERSGNEVRLKHNKRLYPDE